MKPKTIKQTKKKNRKKNLEDEKPRMSILFSWHFFFGFFKWKLNYVKWLDSLSKNLLVSCNRKPGDPLWEDGKPLAFFFFLCSFCSFFILFLLLVLFFFLDFFLLFFLLIFSFSLLLLFFFFMVLCISFLFTDLSRRYIHLRK